MLEGDKYCCPRFTDRKKNSSTVLLKAASEICGRDGSKGMSAVLIAMCVELLVLALNGTVQAPQPIGMRPCVKSVLATL